MAKFAQYAMAAAEEALEDAGWKPTTCEEKEATVKTKNDWAFEFLNIMAYLVFFVVGSLPGFGHWQFR